MALSYSYTSILHEVRLALDPLRPNPSSSPTAVASSSPSPTQTSSTTAAAAAAAMGYFQRFSSFPPSPTPSTSSKASSTNDSLLESRSFLSVFKAKANTFPLVRKPTVASLPKIAPPPTPPLNPEDNNNNNLNALGLSYRLDPSTPLTAKSNDLLSWHRHQSPAEEYAAMPLQRREAALERVNKMRAWLSVPEKNLDSSTREWQSTTTCAASQKGHAGVGLGVVSRVTTPPSPSQQSSRNKQLCQSDSPYCTIGATARQEQQPLAAHQRNDNSSFYSDVPKATTTKKVFSGPCLQPAFSV